jgi:cytidylate kinase
MMEESQHSNQIDTIAIDGPAASGKSTLAERLAARLGFLYFDTGVMYRAVTLAALQANVDINDEQAVSAIAEDLSLDVRPPTIDDGRQYDVIMDGDDVTWDIRSSDVDTHVSQVSAYPGVRAAMTCRQREIGKRGKVVMVGRDIGTVVMPQADLKLYLDASVEARADRRFKECQRRGEPVEYTEILAGMRERDRIDSTRSLAPLRPAQDAVVLDSTGMTIEQVVEEAMRLVREWDPPLKNRIPGIGKAYDHQALERRRWILRWMIKHIAFNLLMKYHGSEGVENIPEHGAGIVMINHIAFVDPIVAMASSPRNIVPMAKVEAFKYPVWGIFPKIWQVIPVHREEVDRAAIRMALNVLRAGELILVAPEGTRNRSLQEGREGVAYLGLRSGAPVIPTAILGSEGFPTINPLRWRGPGAVAHFGKPFRFRPIAGRVDRDTLRKMTDEAMYVLAGMLPEERRGFYADLSKATTDTLEFL